MDKTLRPWLSGFAIIESKMIDSERQLTLEFWLPEWIDIYFRIRLLDKHEDEIASETGNQEFDIERQMETSAAGKIPFGKRFERAREIFRGRQFRRVRLSVKFSESAYKDAVYFALDVAEVSQEVAVQTRKKQWYQQPSCIHLQTDRRNLQKNDSGYGNMFLLVTQEQARIRTDDIIEKYPRLRWRDWFTAEAQLELWRRMFKGKDSPLLTNRVSRSRVFTKMVCGAVKFAKRGKRKSNRFEWNVFLEDIPAPEYDPTDLGPSFVDPHQLQIAQKHIEEVARDRVQAEILTGQIQGDKVADMAKLYKLDVRNSQIHVSRSRTRLGLPPRRNDQPSK